MQTASRATVLGDFSDAEFDYFGERSRFFERDGRFLVETGSADGEPTEYTIQFVFGIEPLQQYLVEFPGGRLQTLPFAWDTRPQHAGGQRWFHVYPDQHIAPGDDLHWTGPQQNWNYMCAECHSTNVELNYDLAADRFDTTYDEISVGCEGCHGPGSAHVEQASVNDFENSRRGLEVNLDDRGRANWIINPETGIAERSELAMRVPQQPETCGRCHARRGLSSETYEHGKPLADTHVPALLEDGLYFDDGQILDEVYVYGSFLQSRMYEAGVTCSDCHNPHSAKLVTGENPSDVCSQCHLPQKFAVEEHTGHAAAAVACVDCHMTSRTYMVVDDRRDHSFRIPRPDLAAKTGSPSACANCHADKDDDWAVAALRNWHGDGVFARPEFATALHAARKGNGNEELTAVIRRTDTPGIARATAIGELEAPLGRADVDVITQGLSDPDPLVRIAALRQLRNFPDQYRLQYGVDLLDDDVRNVRFEAAFAFADIHAALPGDARVQFESAASDFEAARMVIANRPEAHTAVGDLEVRMGRLEGAVGRFEQALAIDPRFTPARSNLVDVLRQLGDDERGAGLLADGLELNPEDAALHHAQGLLLVREGDPEAGIAALTRAAELAPGNARYVYVVGVGLNSIGRVDDAIATLSSAWRRFPADYDIGWALATTLRDIGETERALNVVGELEAEFPDDQNLAALRRSLEIG